MSVFVNNLKTFTSDFTGEEREYRVNNKLWVTMQEKFNLKQVDWAQDYDNQRAYYGAIFAYSLLVANKIDVTFDEVVENTDLDDLGQLMSAYIDSLYDDEQFKDALQAVEEAEEDNQEDKKNPS